MNTQQKSWEMLISRLNECYPGIVVIHIDAMRNPYKQFNKYKKAIASASKTEKPIVVSTTLPTKPDEIEDFIRLVNEDVEFRVQESGKIKMTGKRALEIMAKLFVQA